MRIKNSFAWRAKIPRNKTSVPFISWLRDRGSLTARLEARGSFAVSLLQQRMTIPSRDEALALGIQHNRLARLREVVLFCDDHPLVFARTVLSCCPRGPMTGWLARLGNRSLGALLFSHPGFVRGAIHCKRLDHRHALFLPAVDALQLAAKPPATLWARRSLFSFGVQSVLVTEIFSPVLITD
jgi:chorismate lyase